MMNESSSHEQVERSSSTQTQGARILVIEDDVAFAELLEGVLRDHGYEVQCAHTVTQGRTLLTKAPFDLVLSDVRLPGGLGVEFLFFEESAGKSIPLLMMTAFGSPELKGFVEGMGVGLLEKPFSIDVLLDRVLKVILERHAEHAPDSKNGKAESTSS